MSIYEKTDRSYRIHLVRNAVEAALGAESG
jgi:hypothetical protein